MIRACLRGAPIAALLFLLCAHPSRAHADSNNFRPEVMACEDAVSYLAQCCPHFDEHQLQCDYLDESDGCDSPRHQIRPALTAADSQCIVGMSCGALVENGVCDRAQVARGSDDWCGGGDGQDPCTEPLPKVCR